MQHNHIEGRLDTSINGENNRVCPYQVSEHNEEDMKTSRGVLDMLKRGRKASVLRAAPKVFTANISW